MRYLRRAPVLLSFLVLAACGGAEPDVRSEGTWPHDCEPLSAEAPEVSTGLAGKGAPTRTGPGDGFPAHSRGALDHRERVYVVQECAGWLQARTVPEALLRRERLRLGEADADAEILFWVRRDHVRFP